MSETEMDNMPAPHTFVASGTGLMRWVPQIESINVYALPQGRQQLRITLVDQRLAIDLSAEEAGHLARLLSGDITSGSSA